VRPGWVYILGSDLGFVKIGKTTGLDRRIARLSIQLPFPTHVLGIIFWPDVDKLEHDLHEQFADKRVNGEWFRLTPDDREVLRGYATLGFLMAPPEFREQGEALRGKYAA
jgi:hypothetical protein